MPIRNPPLKLGLSYHVYNRGFLGMIIFENCKDFRRFEYKTAYYAKKFGVNVKHFALMDNHFHFYLKDIKLVSVSKFMQKLCQSYAMYFNIKYRRRGPVFDSRFKSKAVTELEYLRTLERYIANNPVKARIKVCENTASIGLGPELK